MTQESENKKKLTTFFGAEYQSLKAYVNSRLKASVNRDAEDLIQDVALKLFSGAANYGPINNVAGFVYRSLKNKIIDSMRTNKNRTVRQDENEVKLNQFTALIYDTPDTTYSEHMKSALKQQILSLKPDYRNIIIAIDFEGYTYKEIAAETGIPEGTLMSRRHRAISLLYKKLETKKEQIN